MKKQIRGKLLKRNYVSYIRFRNDSPIELFIQSSGTTRRYSTMTLGVIITDNQAKNEKTILLETQEINKKT